MTTLPQLGGDGLFVTDGGLETQQVFCCSTTRRGGDRSRRGGPRAAGVADDVPTVVSGCIGPRGDGHDPGGAMTVEEAIGIVNAAAAEGIPSAISFTVETDGRLPTGQSLHDAIDQVDAATDTGAAYFMVNCAHPMHFSPALEHEGAWRHRIVGLRANCSRRSHAELDEATELDEADPHELGGGTDARHVAAVVSAWITN